VRIGFIRHLKLNVIMLANFVIIITFNIVAVSSCSSSNHSDEFIEPTDSIKTKAAVIDGTFIPYYLVADWNDSRWEEELSNLKGLGMHYLILSPTVYTDKNNVTKSIYPSSYATSFYKSDVVDNCLRNAAKYGFKVFVGLNSNVKWWSWWQGNSKQWLIDQMSFGNKIAKELFNKYKKTYSDSFYGWYWDWEVDNLNYTTDDRQQALIEALNTNVDYLNDLRSSMPIMLSPFMNYQVGYNAYQYAQMWKKVFAGVHFRKGDVFCPQDGIGAGGLVLDNVEEWFKQLEEAVKTKSGLLFWANNESFDVFSASATLNRFVSQIQKVHPYVSNHISFCYSWYYSPYRVNKAFNQGYSDYVKNTNLPTLPVPPSVVNLRAFLDSSNKINITWEQPQDRSNVAGYFVYRGDKLIANYQYDISYYCNTTYTEDEKLNPGEYIYSVCSYNVNGVCSPKSSVKYTSSL
jgi:hypothetical protein